MTNPTLRLAAIQMVSGQAVSKNLEVAAALIEKAVAQGANFILLPEFFGVIADPQERLAVTEKYGDMNPQQAPIQAMLRRLSKQHGIWLIGGSVPLTALHHANKIRNSLLAFNPQGQCVARYDKIHLFGFSHGTEHYNESQFIEEGDTPMAFDADGHDGTVRVGTSICYDLRFPELYRKIGPIDILLMPAAFTHTTGKDHWEVLLRARAIENQCFVIAAAQGGIHDNGRRTFGHSMIIDPWGHILACHIEGEGIAIADFDRMRMNTVRQQLPALLHRKISL